VTPVVLVAVALTLLLPFVSFRVEIPADDGDPAMRIETTYTGLAPATGQDAHTSGSTRRDGDAWREEHSGRERIPGQADDSVHGARSLTLLALALLTVGLAVAALPVQRLRAMLSAATALLAALALLTATLRSHQLLSGYAEELLGEGSGELVELRYGFWLAAGLLVVVGFANVALSVPGPVRPEPAEARVG
jgi:hypothetical protein